MLVHNDRSIPAHPVADIDHGAREVNSLALVERKRGTGGQKGGEMDLGIAACDHVAHDFGKGVRVEAIAIYATAHARQRLHGRRMGHRHIVILANAEDLPGCFRKTDFILSEQCISFDLKERCLYLSRADRDEDLGARGQTLRAADMAIGAHHHHGLVLSVQPQAPHA